MSQVLFHNANVVTMDGDCPRAEAVLVSGDRIVAVGKLQEVDTYAGSDARRVNLGGRTVVPGFHDNHLHCNMGGASLTQTDLSGLDAEQVIRVLKEQYDGIKPGETVTGFRWDYTSCPDPHRSLLDAAFPNNPVLLFQYGGHGIWVNSKTLRLMGIDASTPDPPIGKIVRDENGEPTGIAREMYSNRWLQRHYRKQDSDPQVVEANIRAMMEELPRLGITSVGNNTWFLRNLSVLLMLRRSGELPARVTSWFFGEHLPASLRAQTLLMKLPRYDNLWLRRGAVKYLLDGTFSSRSAWLTEPYANDPDNCGNGRPSGEIAGMLKRRVRRKQQVACHAIGDRAVKEYLDAIEALQRRFPWTRELRFRVEHAQLIREEDVPRLRRLGVAVAAQPHAQNTPEKDLELLGEARFRNAYPYRWYLDEGVALSFGSDFPGESTLDPLLGIHRAVNRPGPQQISVEEALRCYTLGSAEAEFHEADQGSITAGKLADMAVLSEDPTAVNPARIRELKVQMTIVGGNVVFGAGAGVPGDEPAGEIAPAQPEAHGSDA